MNAIILDTYLTMFAGPEMVPTVGFEPTLISF